MKMANKSQESIFQSDIINQMVEGGWQLGSPAGYNCVLALYEEDVLGFVQETHTINYHLKEAFADSELQENSVIRNF